MCIEINYIKPEGIMKDRNCAALHNLVPFVQFKKREKQPWRSVTFSKAAG